MSTFTQALDNLSIRNNGENGQVQEGWSSRSFEEGITKLFYQLVRVNKNDQRSTLNALYKLYQTLVNNAVHHSNNNQINFLISLLFQTRDICGGKGEYQLFYNFLPVWDAHFLHPSVHKTLTSMLVLLFDVELAYRRCGIRQVHSYGSWKDFKKILEVFKNNNSLTDSQAIAVVPTYSIPAFIIQLVSEQFDIMTDDNTTALSLLARWLPREKSKYGWQAHVLAPYLTPSSSKESTLKKYRRTIAGLNKKLRTVQIDQCSNNWANINFDKDCTSITMARQKKAFMCQGSNTEARHRIDRRKCSINFTEYINDCRSGKKKIKSARASPGDMVKEFWFNHSHGCHHMSDTDKDTFNLMWKQQSEDSNLCLRNCVPILDTSGSMTWENCPLYDAAAIALKIAEASSIGKRVMTFSSSPKWVNLEQADTLDSMVTTLINSSNVGMSTNMQAAFKLVCDACVSKDMAPEEVEDIVLVVLSDMQADKGDNSIGHDIFEEIVNKMFFSAGLTTSHKRPYSPPTMVWWNMRTTNGSPCSTTTKNHLMMSGYDVSVLSDVMESGIDSLKQLTAWDNLEKMLSKDRYSWAWN